MNSASFAPCRFQALLCAFLAFTVPIFAQDVSVDIDHVNRRRPAQQHPVHPRIYDSHPAFVEPAESRGFLVWHSFEPGRERIVGRVLGGRDNQPFIGVSAGSGTMTPAELAMGEDGGLAFAWSAWRGNHWVLEGRRRDGDTWPPVVELSAPGTDALQVTIESTGAKTFALAWTQWRGAGFELWWAPWNERGIADATRFSDVATDAFRPSLVAGPNGALHAVWDAYAQNTSVIHARQLLPVLGPIETVSTSPDRCLKAVAARDADGKLLAAWIRATDVIGGAGAIDQVHVIELARREANGWELLKNQDGSEEIAWLTKGLLARLEPERTPTGGYMGRRRDPMFVRDGDAVWLIWERKTPHEGSTWVATGELLGRKIDGEEVGPTVALTAGRVDYHVADDAEVRDGRFTVLSSSLPRHGERNYLLETVVLSEAVPARTEPWLGWKRAELPLAEAEPTQHIVREDGRDYHLFWMDSHVHSALSADAEGEPDEILFYARDRGRLDAVVVQENDFYICPLTDYEYQLGAFYARALSRVGEFVALPGYEWTQRLPDESTAPIDKPRFWGNTHPNHRTVIYPRAGGPLIRFTDVRNDISRLYEAVAKHGGIVHAQHAEFDFTGAPVEVAIEVTAGWGTYFLNPELIHSTLNKGFRAGFVGTSDSHRRNPGLGGGLTGIYATGLTPDALLEAYRARRVFATSGARIAVEARANGVLMGQESTVGERVKLTLHVAGSRPIRRATLLRDGVDLKVFAQNGTEVSADFEYEVTEANPGTHWFYWRIEQEGVTKHYGGNVSTAFGNLAWSTPNWVTFKP
ncbi:MAG: hypothetical protein ACREIA_08315 [Opitutaceae bacterium]